MAGGVWAALEHACSPFVLVVLGTFVVHQAAWLLFNLPYLYIADHGLFAQYKLQPQDRTTSAQRWATFRTLVRDHFTQMLPLLVLSYPLLRYFRFSVDSESLPSWLEFACAFVTFNVIEDTGFYWVHRLLHSPALYKSVHWKHHTFVTPYSLAGEVAHPAEFLFNFLLPLVAGPFLWGCFRPVHITTFWCWIVFRELRSVDAHSGYALPFPLMPLRILSPIYGGARMHDLHHTIKGQKSNFGGYRFWDWACGTDYETVCRAQGREAR